MSHPVAARLLAASLGCAVAFFVLAGAVAVGAEGLTGLDERTSARLYGFTVEHAAFERVVRAVTALGDGLTVTLVTAAVALWCASRKEWVLGWWLVGVVCASAILNTLVKVGLGRARPATEGELVFAHGFSFPSGHTQAATVTYTAVVLVVAWTLLSPGGGARLVSAVVVTAVIAAVGLSRILLGVHWPTDVLGGWLLGSAWVTGATFVLIRYGLRARDDRPGP